MRHAVSGIFSAKKKPTTNGASSPKKPTGLPGPKAPPLPGAVPPKPPKPQKPQKARQPKSAKPGIRRQQKAFKARVKLRNTANPPKGPNSKPLNKQQRAQGALDAMAAWKQKRKVSP